MKIDWRNPDVFLSRVEVLPSGCWRWTGSHTWDGYPRCGTAGYAHRLSYELFVGPIPPGKQIDHFRCDWPGCVNPQHLRPATPLENTLRSNALQAWNKAKRHCVHGHPFDQTNTYVKPNGTRVCRTCKRERQRGWRSRALAAESK